MTAERLAPTERPDEKVGNVLSTKMQKTIVVVVETAGYCRAVARPARCRTSSWRPPNCCKIGMGVVAICRTRNMQSSIGHRWSSLPPE
jgi:ribosomal protein S17